MIRIAAALVLSLSGAQVLAAGGALDTTLGNKGFAPVFESTNETNLVFARAPDGKYIVVQNRPDAVVVMRRKADGTPDTTFGTAGQLVHGRAAPTGSTIGIVPLAVKRIQFQGSKILLAGEATSACGTPGVARLNANGTVDQTFANRGWSTPVPASRGVFNCNLGTDFEVPDFRILPDGRIAMVGQPFTPFNTSAVNGDTVVARWLATGQPDTAFNGNGYVAGLFSWTLQGGGARVLADGSSAFVRGQPDGGSRFAVIATRLSADGRTRSDNVLNVGEEFRTGAVSGVVQEDGAMLIYRREVPGGTLAVAKFVANQPAAGYGTGGVARIALGHPSFVRHALATPDGGTLFLADLENSVIDGRNDAIVLLKLDAIGIREPSFGLNGRVDLSSSALTEFPHQALIESDGYLALFGYTTFRSGGDTRYTWYFVRVQAVPDIVEFENTILRHYFVTYDNAEARGIDAGAAGAGWVRTGLRFRPGGPATVCRFQGTPGVGPNSHFYTADADECALVKTLRGWTYEGLGFSVTPPTDGLCHTLQPVFRLYNNRAAQNDSNHRFLVSEALIESMVATGWILEGLVFCAPR